MQSFFCFNRNAKIASPPFDIYRGGSISGEIFAWGTTLASLVPVANPRQLLSAQKSSLLTNENSNSTLIHTSIYISTLTIEVDPTHTGCVVCARSTPIVVSVSVSVSVCLRIEIEWLVNKKER